ncbi:MAG TPA: cupredoxin domain-containing protein, partial [Actinomycetota bacterium]|nr:cupredoxin domain-containing protein [Actinomycetota bacterium]
MLKRGMVVAVVGASLLLSACGGGDAGGDAGGETGGDTAGGGATLTMVDNAFEPADATFTSGEEIELVNDGEALHNLTVEGSGIDEDVEAGQSSTVAVDLDPGEYAMFCEYHRAAGMEGT